MKYVSVYGAFLKVSERRAYMSKPKMPLSEKYLLTVEEAAKYFGIGRDKLYRMSDFRNGHVDWVIYNGNRRLIKREQLEEIISKSDTI